LNSFLPIPEDLSPTARLYILVRIAEGFAGGIYGVVFQLYLISIGFGSAEIGALGATSAIGLAVLSLPAGLLADRYGKAKIALLQAPLGISGLAIILSSRSFPMLQLAHLLLGMNGAVGMLWGPLYSVLFKRGDLDKAFSLLGSISILSSSMGNLMGFIPPYLVSSYGYSVEWSYWLLMAMAFMIWLVTISFNIMVLRKIHEPQIPKTTVSHLRSRRTIAKLCIIRSVEAFGFSVFFNLFPYFANKKFGVKSDVLGVLSSLTNFVSAVVQANAPRLSTRLGSLKSIGASVALCVPFYFLIPLAPDMTVMSVFYVARRAFKSSVDPLMSSFTMKVLEEEEKGTANGIISLVQQGTNIAGPWVGGRLMADVSLDVPAYLGATFFGIQAVMVLLMLKPEEEKILRKDAEERGRSS